MFACVTVCFGDLKTPYASSTFIPRLFPVRLCRTLRRAGDYREIEEIKKRREDQEERASTRWEEIVGGGSCGERGKVWLKVEEEERRPLSNHLV